MMTLRYRPNTLFGDLRPGECTVHRTTGGGARWWQLWFCSPRDTDGLVANFCVSVQIGPYTDTGPGGRTWGLTRAGARQWRVSPSINVLVNSDATESPMGLAVGGAAAGQSLWHHSPLLVGVPDDEPWVVGEAP